MVLPTFVAAGTPAVAANGDSISPGIPAGVVKDDYLLLFVVHNASFDAGELNYGVAPPGWDNPSIESRFTNIAQIEVFAKFAQDGEADPEVLPRETTDPGDGATYAVILAFRNVSHAAINVSNSGITLTEGSDTSLSIPGATTTVDGCLVVAACARVDDAAGSYTTDQFSGWANASLASVTERFDNGAFSTTSGNEYNIGLGVATGTLATAGAYGATTATLANASEKAFVSIALLGGPTITDVEGDESFTFGDTGVTVTGTDFGATGNTVELASTSDYDTAVKTTQTITSEGTTSIDFTAVQGGVAHGTRYLFVTNDIGQLSRPIEVEVASDVVIPAGAGAFTNPVPDGYRRGNVITPAQVAQFATQANQMADAAHWSELVYVSNWQRNFEIEPTPFSAYGSIKCAIYDTRVGRWVIFGDDGASPANAIGANVPVTADAGSDLTALTINNSTTFQPKVCATDGAGVIIVAGGNDSSSNEKYRKTTSSGSTYTVKTAPSASTAIATGIVYDPANDIWVACFDDGTIHRSTDDGENWTDVSPSSPTAITSVAVDDTGIILAATATHVVRSLNGSTWTKVYLPSTNDGKIVWVGANIRRFFIIGEDTALWSRDGLEWFSHGVTSLGFANPVGLSVCHRMMACMDPAEYDIYASIDGGKTWKCMWGLTGVQAVNVASFFQVGPYGAIAVATETSNTEDDELFLGFHGRL